jgi:hypothetical protein
LKDHSFGPPGSFWDVQTILGAFSFFAIEDCFLFASPFFGCFKERIKIHIFRGRLMKGNNGLFFLEGDSRSKKLDHEEG